MRQEQLQPWKSGYQMPRGLAKRWRLSFLNVPQCQFQQVTDLVISHASLYADQSNLFYNCNIILSVHSQNMAKKTYWVYILSNSSGTLYTGVTNDLMRRVAEHKAHDIDGFTKTYQIDRLVYMEETDDVSAALAREKEIKKWNRDRKLELIRGSNPHFEDLSEGWF